jgi:hypothetical protein
VFTGEPSDRGKRIETASSTATKFCQQILAELSISNRNKQNPAFENVYGRQSSVEGMNENVETGSAEF